MSMPPATLPAPDEFAPLRALLAGRYDLEAPIGRGGSAAVFRALDRKHQRQVALKVLRPEVVRDLGADRFLQEIDIAARLVHPHILPLFDSGETGGFLWFTMPFIAGDSLRQRIGAEGSLSVAEAVGIARDVASALAYAHASGVVHRDIKPENVLLQDGQALVADFGIARAVSSARHDEATLAGLAVGTPQYMSPEQASGAAALDGRSDIYALGVVLYEMLVGMPPFDGETPHRIMGRHLAEPPPPIAARRPGLPVPLVEALDRALAKDPARRFSTAGEFERALDRALGNPTPTRTLTPVTAPPVRPRQPALVAAGALAVAGLAWFALARRPEPPPAAPAGPDRSRVAVLYFEERTPGRAPISAAVTEDLIDELSRVPGLRVVSPNGVRPWRDQPLPLDSLARRLGVGTVVNGTVERRGDVVRVTVRLVDPATSSQLASASVEQGDRDPFTLRQRLAETVGRFLRTRLGREIALEDARRRTRDAEAWRLYQEARTIEDDAYLRWGTRDSRAALEQLDRAVALLRRAADRDRAWGPPVEQLGWIALARARSLAGGTVADTAMVLREVDAALRSADRLLAASGDSATMLSLRGAALLEQARARPRDADALRAEAERALRRAIAIRPSDATAWRTLSGTLDAQGRVDEANAAALRALEEDAFLAEAPAIRSRLIFSSLALEQWAQADSLCAGGQRDFPDDLRFRECDLVVMGSHATGDAAVRRAWERLAAIERADSAGRLAASRHARRLWVAAVLARSGAGDSALGVLRRARAEAAATEPPLRSAVPEAYVFLLTGRRDSALALLDAAVRAGVVSPARVRGSPWFRALKGDAAFEALVSSPGSAP
ncbi:MAG: protein kinase [Gemmatimonadales bacterium]|nr:protein kinase [Gemmatimonadales bacterium]